MKAPFLFIALFLIAFGCNDIIEFSQEDAERQPWLASFTRGFEIIDGKHDLTNDIIHIDLYAADYLLYFLHADSIALGEGWEKCYTSYHSRIYLKNIPYKGVDEKNFLIFSDV